MIISPPTILLLKGFNKTNNPIIANATIIHNLLLICCNPDKYKKVGTSITLTLVIKADVLELEPI